MKNGYCKMEASFIFLNMYELKITDHRFHKSTFIVRYTGKKEKRIPDLPRKSKKVNRPDYILCHKMMKFFGVHLKGYHYKKPGQYVILSKDFEIEYVGYNKSKDWRKHF